MVPFHDTNKLLFFLGVLGSALLWAVISVYILHDVDRDQIGHLNTAFAGLCKESVIFAVILSGGVRLLTFLGRLLLRLKPSSSRTGLGLALGASVPFFRYAGELAIFHTLPKRVDLFRIVYIPLAIIVCAAVILADNLKHSRSTLKALI